MAGSANPSYISAGLAELSIPLMNMSGPLSVELALANNSGETACGDTWITMTPETADHPLAAGLVGQQDVFVEPVATLNYGEVGAEAIVIADTPGSPSFPTHFAYETGTTLADGTEAPARRLAIYPTLDGLSVVSGVSAQLYLAGIDWLLGRT